MLYMGVFWKIQNICYVMGTEIFKIEEEMTETSLPYFGVKLSCVCLMYAYRKKSNDISTLYLYRRHNQTTLQKNLHLNQKGVMNQLLASI